MSRLCITNDPLCAGVKYTVGETLDISAVLHDLSALGYTRVDRIERAGEFALRGDILDIWGERANRILFFDNEIEAIKQINPDNFLTIKNVQNVHINPVFDGVNYAFSRAKICVLGCEIDVFMTLNRTFRGVFLCKNPPKNLRLRVETWVEKELSAFKPDTKIGALVMHEKHGLGRYIGTKRMNIGNGTQNYLAVQYDRRAVIYVPQSQHTMLFNYHGAQKRLDHIY
jgi:transcription-repair coupling factor (superfamily II helicase)